MQKYIFSVTMDNPYSDSTINDILNPYTYEYYTIKDVNIFKSYDKLNELLYKDYPEYNILLIEVSINGDEFRPLNIVLEIENNKLNAKDLLNKMADTRLQW